jgi:hypothetical protein
VLLQVREVWPPPRHQGFSTDTIFHSELRVYLDLPSSGITKLHYPDPFPAPPGGVSRAQLNLSDAELLNRERSWYYFLTDISPRRVGNQVLNTLYNGDSNTWLEFDFQQMCHTALQFEEQLEQM